MTKQQQGFMQAVILMASLAYGGCGVDVPSEPEPEPEPTSTITSEVTCGALTWLARDGYHGQCSCGDYTLPCSGWEAWTGGFQCVNHDACRKSCKRSGNAFYSSTQGVVFSASTGWSCMWVSCEPAAC